jgi:fructose-bisphosphate aldolase class 1
MRSVIKTANEKGIKTQIKQQFELAIKVIQSDSMPIIELEVGIDCSE